MVPPEKEPEEKKKVEKVERVSLSEGRKKQVDKYDLKETLGQGMFGRVKRAINKETGEEVAIKVMNRASIQDLNLGPQIKEEIRLMSRINHPNIVRLIEVLASQKTLFIVMDLVIGGELMKKIVKEGKFPEPKARKYFRQLIDGLFHCHERGVCHRDLKPENLLLDSHENLKISDFGLAAALYGPDKEKQVLRTTCGSPNYVAPEVLLDRGYDGERADVWSSGVILYLLLAGFLPFDEVKMVDLFRKIMKAEISYPKEFSTDVKSLLGKIFNPDPEKRISIKEIKEHPWFLAREKEEKEEKSQPPAKEEKSQPPDKLPLKRQESAGTREIVRNLSEAESEGVEFNDMEEEDDFSASKKPESPKDSPKITSPSTSQIREGDFLNVNPTTMVKPIDRPGRRKEAKLDLSNGELLSDGAVTIGNGNRSRSGSNKGNEIGEKKTDGQKEDLSPQPSKMNAFDLINMVGGAAVSRMFRGDEENGRKQYTPNFTQFPSSLQADQVIAAFEKILDGEKKKKDCLSYNSNRKHCWVEAKMSQKKDSVVVGEIDLKIQVYEMTPTLRLVEIKKNSGDDVAYFEVYNKIKKLFELASKLIQEETPPSSGLGLTPKSPSRSIPIPKPSNSRDSSPVGSPMVVSLMVPTSGIRSSSSSPSTPTNKSGDKNGFPDTDQGKTKKKKGIGGLLKGLTKKKNKDKDKDID